jgi:pyridoxamine 5'-phosphate oxidase family protein
MSVFTENEIEYMKEQRLGRLATVDAEGRPRVVPVGWGLDLGAFNQNSRSVG